MRAHNFQHLSSTINFDGLTKRQQTSKNGLGGFPGFSLACARALSHHYDSHDCDSNGFIAPDKAQCCFCGIYLTVTSVEQQKKKKKKKLQQTGARCKTMNSLK